jgi:hypothetical protein
MVVVAALSAGGVNAGLVNPDFETGDLTGWTTSLTGGAATVEPFHIGDFGTYFPGAGSYFLRIVAGTEDIWQTVSQSVALNEGDVLSGWVAFDWRDYDPIFDGARVQITANLGGTPYIATPFEADGSSGPNFADYAPVFWSWTAPVAGTYTLEYAVRNTLDDFFSSVGLFDADVITYEAFPPSAVPEPAGLALAGAAGLGACAWLRRRRSMGRV